MTCKELISYLSEFKPDLHLAVTVIDKQRRLVYSAENLFYVDEAPALFINVGKANAIDDVVEMFVNLEKESL